MYIGTNIILLKINENYSTKQDLIKIKKGK